MKLFYCLAFFLFFLGNTLKVFATKLPIDVIEYESTVQLEQLSKRLRNVEQGQIRDFTE
jgi:hypothetical protein